MIAYGTDYADSFPPPTIAPGVVTVSLADVEPERVDWLWYGRLPIGKIVVLDGDPSVGKSTAAVDCAARISTGRAWPDGEPNRRGSVLLLSAEDGLADTIRPRLDAAGGNPDFVHALTEIRYLDENDQIRTRPVTLADLEHIETAVRRTSAALVVIDVMMAFLPTKVDSHRDQDIRGVMSSLAAMAERTRCCILLLRHLNKASGGSAMYRGGGSIGIIGAARVGLLAAHDPEDENRRVLAGIKSNLAPLPDALAYQLVDSPDHGCARVEWLGASGHSAGDLLRHGGDEADEADELVQMLRVILDDANGEIPAADAVKRLRAFGAAPAKGTLHRARKRAGIESVKAGFGGGWVWRYTAEGDLPARNTSSPEGSGVIPEGSEGSASQSPGPFGTIVDPSTVPSEGVGEGWGRMTPTFHEAVKALNRGTEAGSPLGPNGPDGDHSVRRELTEPIEAPWVPGSDWQAGGVETATQEIIARYGTERRYTVEAAMLVYNAARKFHSPSEMIPRIVAKMSAPCGHPLIGVTTDTHRCGQCILEATR